MTALRPCRASVAPARAAILRALLALACIAPGTAGAATYYVRPDGGSAAQCTGRSDAAYPGSGTARRCAWSHPFIALPPSAPERPTAPRIAGGDTLVIAHGNYMMGFGAAGAPEMASCYASFTADCHMQPVPPGPDAAHRTRILGEGWDTGCRKPPELWGTRATHRILDLTGSSHAEVACLELTDHSSCIVNHCIAGNCTGGPAQIDRCGNGGDGEYAQNGLWSTDAADVRLHDLDIHGIGGEGVHAGRMTDWRVQRVRIWANGFAGWDADVSNGGVEPTSNSGTLYFSELEIGWSGCGERYPGKAIFGCWGQGEGGYGDGFSTGRSGGRWLFEDSHAHHNTQDGFDLLYLDHAASVEFRRVRAEDNAGNQIKVSGDATIADSDIAGHCAYFRGVGNMQEGDHCRADGAAIAVALVDGKRSVVTNTRVTGEGGCLVVGSGGGKDAVLVLRDDTLTGQPRWNDKSQLACGYYLYESQGKVEASGNRISNVKTSSTMNEFCARQAKGSILDGACERIRNMYHALRDGNAGSLQR